MIEYSGEYAPVYDKEQADKERKERMKMVELLSSDFRPLEGFVYLWRWTNVLPEADLAQIRPLLEAKVKEVWRTAFVYSSELWRYAGDSPSSLFEWIQHMNILVEGTDMVPNALAMLEPHGGQIVIVMWEPTVAVAVPWHIFCIYWQDFCYPSSDDVSIWPLSERWGLYYHHEEQLIFGKSRLPLLDQTAREKIRNSPARPLVHRDEVLRELRANEKIAAVKLYRHDTGVPYPEAIDAVEKLSTEVDDRDDLPK